jgi:hypothetical protein
MTPCELTAPPLMRPALKSVFIQALGSAATVLAALGVTFQLGLAAQGQFSLLRSWNDALMTLAVMGLPQALLHLQYRQSVRLGGLFAWVKRYVLGLLGGVILLSAAVWWLPGVPVPVWMLWVVLAGVPLAAAHLLCRSLMLRDVSRVVYALVTIAPAVLLLVGVQAVCFWGDAHHFVWALLFSAGGSALISGWAVWRLLEPQAPAASTAPTWSRSVLWSVGFESGVQNTLTALGPALLLSTLSWLGAPLSQVGAVSLGLHVYQLFGIAATYVSPMLYDRAAAATHSPSVGQWWARLKLLFAWSWLWYLFLLCFAALSLVQIFWSVALEFQGALGLMAVAGVLSLAVRLLMTLMLTRAAFRPLTYQAVLRLGCITGGAAALMPFTGALLAAPLALCLTEGVLLLWLLWLLRHEQVLS